MRSEAYHRIFQEMATVQEIASRILRDSSHRWAGYIGSHAVKALRAAGFAPLIFDNFSAVIGRSLRNPLFEGDVCNPPILIELRQAFHRRGAPFCRKGPRRRIHAKPELYYQ